MEMQKFIENIAEQFDDADASVFKADTKFKTLADWSSVVALSIISVIDEEYSVTIKGDDIKKSETIEDLYNIVNEYLS